MWVGGGNYEPDIASEVVELLGCLIRTDTSNPPGNETAVALVLDEYFRRHGLVGEIVGESVDRQSYVLRVDSGRPGPSLLLLSHEDVVPATEGSWSHPPYSGAVSAGYVWGRGAVDVKNLVAANAVAVRRVVAADGPKIGSIVYAATADEERGDVNGVQWLIEHRPDLVQCDFVINEGGAHVLTPEGRHVYFIETGEKGTAQFKIVVHGAGGHASRRLRREAALPAAAEIILALHRFEAPLIIDDAVRDLVELLVGDGELREALGQPSRAPEALARLAAKEPSVAGMIEPLCGYRFSPTVVGTTNAAVNVHPSQVQISVDCRVPVGFDPMHVEREVRSLIREIDAEWSFEWISTEKGNASRAPTALSDAIETAMSSLVPNAQVAFSHCVGFTDSNWFRAAFPDTVAYGFTPYFRATQDDFVERCHNVNERIDIGDLTLQVLLAQGVAHELLHGPLPAALSSTWGRSGSVPCALSRDPQCAPGQSHQ